MAIRFVTELPVSSPIADFAAALRERPGVWAQWPTPISALSAKTYTSKIHRGVIPAFRRGEFQARSAAGVLYVRYIGEVRS
ncbi:hypothetical protein [Nocardia sp. CC227C]|uniref:hypothetical protein n=1 Tax=Nocardia sp. CC227C TaxID=3044562 RepID=UPI00278C2274|nr:hypothetical protein [Nocardia sp. CC227C]